MKRKLLVTGIVGGVILALGPLWGMLAVSIGMMGAFQTLADSGISDPHALSGHINMQLVGLSTGLIACPVGIILLTGCIVALVLDKRQPPPSLPPSEVSAPVSS